jgi:hypothetical protein
MREPVAKRRPMIDIDEFERRLRPPSALRREGDPLAELARLAGGRDDPYKAVFEPQYQRATPAWEGSDHVDYGAHEHLNGDEFAPMEPASPGQERQEASAPLLADVEDSTAFLGIDNGSEHWTYEANPVAAQPQPVYYQDDEIRSRRPLYLMAAIIVIGIAGIGASFAFKSGGSGAREVAMIKAAEGPVKIQPERSVGADIPNQDASILDKSSQAAPVAVVNNAEQPIDLTQIQEKAPRVIALGGARPNSDLIQGSGAASVPVPAPPEPAQPQARTQGEALTISALIEPKKVKTISVRPDGTLLPHDKAPQIPPPARAAPERHAAADAPKASTPKTTARVATTPKPAAIVPEPASPPQSAAARPRPVQTANANPTTAPARSGQTAGGGYAVQLAAPSAEKDARDIQVRLMKKYSDELAGLHPSIRKAVSGGKTVYRVRVGNMSRDEANGLCQRVQSAGGSCFVARN